LPVGRSEIRNELQAVKQWHHIEKDILKHSQIRMSVTYKETLINRTAWKGMVKPAPLTASLFSIS